MGQKNKSNDIWIVVPAFNESKYILRVLDKLLTYTSNIIVVDDGSKDNTAELAAKKAAYVLRHRINLGKGSALKTGCDYAFGHCQARAVVVLDGDDQHDPAVLPEFFAALSTNEVVFGVRDFSQMPAMRTLGNKFGSFLVQVMFGKYIADIPSGYKAFTKHAYSKLRWWSTGYSVEMELAARVAKYQFPVVAIPIPTIYHDFNRGMTVLDTFVMLGYLLNWKVML